MTKIDLIENLDYSTLMNLIKTLLDFMKFQNMREEAPILRAEESSALGVIAHAFVIPNIQLSGTFDATPIVSLLTDTHKKDPFNVITIVSNKYISAGFQNTLKKGFSDLPISYIGRDELISLIDNKFPDFWRHDDSALIEYEHQYEEVMNQENQLKLLHLPTDEYQKIVNIFIQPTLIEEVEDSNSHRLLRKRVDMNDLNSCNQSLIISGVAGAGKSTLLYNIGLSLSKANSLITNKKKSLPVFITAMDLINSGKEVKNVILAKTIKLGTSIVELCEKYDIVLLVDSIDEFESGQQREVIRQLVNLKNNKKIRFILTTRNESHFQEYIDRKDARFFEISRFNNDQIKRFVNSFLPDENKANDLLDSLRENKIIERLPITPLTLSLISILFNESDYEVPATITDIYSKFNDLVVGRAIVSSKIEFIDIAFRERILSMYGYLLMNREDHQALTYEEFIAYFVEVYKGKSKQIKGATLEDGLDYLVRNTGIIYIKNNHVCFAHDTYMEYYAAIEYFRFHRQDESILVNNFFDLMWQNVAVFYAGITKDMDSFAENVNKKLKSASKVMEFISGVQGAGYLLQALYLSDDIVRRNMILTALDLSLNTNEAFKKISTLTDTQFKNYRIPMVQMLSLLHFYEIFNSLTLKAPLELSFDVLKERYEKCLTDESADRSNIPAMGYQLACLAFTLDSKRICNNEPLNYLIGQKPLLNDVNINSLVGISLELIGKTNYREIRDQVRKDYNNLKPLNKLLLDEASSKARFSVLDTVHPFRRVKLFVEGRTDAIILEHAFITLTQGQFPYWNIEMATQNGITGSTHAVTKAIDAGINYSETYDFIIGVFDHDKAGLTAYRSLTKDYDEIEPDCIKRNKIKPNIHLLCIPIPGEMSQYLQKNQDFNFFEIEHYFGHQYLQNKRMLKEDVLRCNVYEISDSKKVSFANSVTTETDPSIFRLFIDLFKKIDQITGVNIDYNE